MVLKDNRAANWRIVGNVDAASRDWRLNVDDEADDRNAAERCRGSGCPRSETKSCSPMFRSDLAEPDVAGKSTASLPRCILQLWLPTLVTFSTKETLLFDRLTTLGIPTVAKPRLDCPSTKTLEKSSS